ncbi:hypothetical protein Cpin_4668 [Sporocytophaga myxococcoides]|uniref:Uncharacterized protein n=1 Tax=Sporocytophaga myxococcoides TaxID=153721 RepID=A0A098LIK7_9BACT|nr:DUF2310 family Zn-ribbon-containing protein [Sporocytophaga myxococcoides]GAL86279.1 hypothetical protein Cpin_4668 [Sporocytophaga myxococcoides]
MHIVKLKIHGGKIADKEFLEEYFNRHNFFEQMGNYLGGLFRNSQIINLEWQYESIEDGFELNLFCPEKDSYKDKYSTKVTKIYKNRLIDYFNCSFEFVYIGLDPEFEETLIYEKPKFLILKSNRISPIHDGDSMDQIPLYKLPYTCNGESFSDIVMWNRDFDHIEGLWYSDYGGEVWTSEQLSNPNSELNKKGRDCCANLEKITGVPTYYYLFYGAQISGTEDLIMRTCPDCKGDWIIEEHSDFRLYDCKCDKCRLVSTMTY